MPSNESCACGDRATNACNDCEAAICDNCSAPDSRCYACNGANREAASLFDDPETVSLEDDDDEDRDPEDADWESLEGWDLGPDFGGEL
jgi:hypothetical protein